MGTMRQVNISASLKQPFALFDVAANVLFLRLLHRLDLLSTMAMEDPATGQVQKAKVTQPTWQQQQC